jgi:hypothetical protein
MFARVSRNVWTTIAAVTASVALAACGANTSNEDQSSQATGSFPAAVSARFPTEQSLAQATNLVIKIRNTGNRTMPNVAVTLTNPKYGSGAQALGTLLAAPAAGQPILAGRSRPIWVIDRAPGPCQYSCQQGGPGAGATAYTNTWALGSLAPGDTKTFDWHVTAVQAGSYTVAYRVAAGLSGQGFGSKPRQASVNNAGKVVYTK